MTVGVEITMYALSSDYLDQVDTFLERLNAHDDIRVLTNNMSTRVIGEYDFVMELLTKEMKTTFDQPGKFSFVMKVLNEPIQDGVLDQ